eukprot:6242156-Karenia_brevis.AAC.1
MTLTWAATTELSELEVQRPEAQQQQLEPKNENRRRPTNDKLNGLHTTSQPTSTTYPEPCTTWKMHLWRKQLTSDAATLNQH